LQKFASVVAWVTLRLVTTVASGSGSGLPVLSFGETSLPIPNLRLVQFVFRSERLTDLDFKVVLRKVIVASVQQIASVNSNYRLEMNASC
jgi:hypothetical protein